MRRLEQELDLFVARGVRRISVLDPIFHANRDHSLAVLAAARARGLRATLSLQCRAELLDDRFLDALEGLSVELELGVQTLDPTEGRAVGRRQDPDRIDDALRRLRARRLHHEVSLIYGLPHQTLASFRRSVSWCLARRVTRVRAFPLMLLRGTPLHQQREQYGYEESDDVIPVAVASHSFTRADFAAMRAIARWLDAHPGADVLPKEVA